MQFTVHLIYAYYYMYLAVKRFDARKHGHLNDDVLYEQCYTVFSKCIHVTAFMLGGLY